MILRRYIWGQPADIQRILNVIHPMNLSMAVKTISRIHQFKLEATTPQHYSLNRVWHTPEPPDLVTDSEAVKYENYFHEDVMDSDNEDICEQLLPAYHALKL